MPADSPAPLVLALVRVGMVLVWLCVGLVGLPEASPASLRGPPSPSPDPDRQVPPIGDVLDVRKRIPFLRECQDVPTNAIKYYDVTTRMAGKVDFMLNGMYNITRSVKDIAEIVILLTKCKEVVSANTCEHFQTWRFKKNICQNLGSGNQIWSKFNNNISPNPTCPPVPGTYHINNATLDMTMLQALPMPLEGHVYRARHYMMESNDVPYICSEAELRFHRARN